MTSKPGGEALPALETEQAVAKGTGDRNGGERCVYHIDKSSWDDLTGVDNNN